MHQSFLLASLFLILFGCFATTGDGAIGFPVDVYQAARSVKALSGDEKKLVSRCLGLSDTDSGIDAKNLSQLRRLVDRSKDARAVYARNLRKSESDPMGALLFAGAGVLPDKTLKNWQKLNATNYDAMVADWTKCKQLAQKNNQPAPEKPLKNAIHADFPACTEWDMSDDGLMCVSEAACALAELGKMKEAFAVCERIGTEGTGVRRLKAHELYADIRSLNEEYKEALKCLDAGEAYAKSFKAGTSNANKREFDAVLKRYKQKRDEIKRLASIPKQMKWYTPDVSEDGTFLFGVEKKLDESALTRQELEKLFKLSQSGEFGRHRARATVLLACCARVAERDAGKALTILMPSLVEKSVADEFVKSYRANYKKAVDEYNDAVRKKESPPVHPSCVLQVPLPEYKSWVITAENSCIVPEVARTLSALGKGADAVEVLLAIRSKLKCVDYIAATEVGIRLFIAQNELKKAEDFCKHGLAMIPHLSTMRNGKLRNDKTGLTNRLRSQLNWLKNNVAQRMEMERYGEGFVRYRDAERERLEKKDFVRAYEGYLRVKNVDSGVYAEAANAYIVKCLLHFATDDGKSELNKYIGERAKVINAKLESLKELKKARLTDAFNKKLENSIRQNQQNLTRLKNIPTGDFALRSAMDIVEKSLIENEFGLYRGEMLTDIGLFHADENCDFKTSETWLTRAETWFTKAATADANLEKFAILGDAVDVTAPPPGPRYKDMFGNILPAEIKPGMIFNRQTSDWYCMDRQKQIVLYLGLFAFANNNRDLASTHWEKLATLDPYLKETSPSMYHRLFYILETHKKALYFDDAEIALFNSKLKNVILLAELNYQSEKWGKSYRLYNNILKSNYGKINKDQAAIALYGKAACIIWLEDTEKFVVFLESHLGNVKGTKAEPKVLLAIAKLSASNAQTLTVPKNFLKIKPKIERLLQYPNTSEGEDGLFMLGWYGMDYDKSYAVKIFTEYLKKYPEGRYIESVKSSLQKLN